jgi:hypothetical protein
MLRLEHRHQPLLSRAEFLMRQLRFGLLSLVLVGASLFLGMAGFRWTEHLSWIDCLLNASMLLGGMGPVNTPASDAGKYFASFYSLYSGMVILVAVGVLAAPLVHRVFHRFHLDPEEMDKKPRRRKR